MYWPYRSDVSSDLITDFLEEEIPKYNERDFLKLQLDGKFIFYWQIITEYSIVVRTAKIQMRLNIQTVLWIILQRNVICKWEFRSGTVKSVTGIFHVIICLGRATGGRSICKVNTTRPCDVFIPTSNPAHKFTEFEYDVYMNIYSVTNDITYHEAL